MNTNDFDYELDKSFIAQESLEKRDEAKLLVMNKYTGELEHTHFYDIIDYLSENDVLVLNNTKVLPARLYGTKEETAAKIEILLLKDFGNNVWQCLVKPQKRIQKNTKITFSNKLSGIVKEIYEDGITNIEMIYQGIFYEILSECGIMPLPPYIHEKLKNNNSYQTVYASLIGSVAAPTAGLHFTEELLKKIKDKGIKIVYVTLHVGIGTFRPVTVDDVTKHKMHSEYYEISSQAAEELNRSKNEGKRIVCVGTTSVRTLESNISKYGKFKSTKEETDIFIYPGYEYKACDALITNFHLPKSTLLMLVSALSKKEYIFNAYEEAKKNNYRFFSFGDAMFITDDACNKKQMYKQILKSFKEEKYILKKENFKIYKGTNNIILSAPHAFKHLRRGIVKKNEYNTASVAKIIHTLKNTHLIYVYKDYESDHNFEETDYKQELSKYIKSNKIKYLIDIHGLEKNEKFDLIIGTNEYKNVLNDKDLVHNIQKIFKNNLSSKIYIDEKYKSSSSTISNYINKNNCIKTLQLEISKDFRKFKKKTVNYDKLIKSLIKVIDLIERWDKDE